jgi:C4-dicarboxylate transporter, DctM subunit
MSNGAVLCLMGLLFLALGYMGVPVTFALIAGVLVATSFTSISMQSMIGQLFHGIDAETLLAVPFFLLVGELMASSDVAQRMIRLSQTLVGHLRGGLAQVVTLFSMFFAGISGSSVADVAVLSRTVAREMDREGYDRAFTAALIASASTMANLIPPSIMAVVYGAIGNVSIGGLFLAGVVPGVLIGVGLMVYSYFFGPIGVMKKRAPFTEVAVAARGASLPLVIPVIIMGGILTGWFTPTEAGMIAAVYIIVVLIPALRPSHVRELPRDFMYAGLLYSLPLAAVAGASAFGWMVAYLRGPDIVASYISAVAGTDPMMIMLLLVVLFVIVGDFIDAVPAIIIFMPIINKLTEVGNINPLHMGVVIITTLVFGLITPPYGLSLLVASKYVGVGFGRAVVRSLPLYIVFFLTIAFTVAFPKVVLWLPKQFLPESVGCFKAPGGAGYICPSSMTEAPVVAGVSPVRTGAPVSPEVPAAGRDRRGTSG